MSPGRQRIVAGTIDAEDTYGSTVAAAGGFVFFSATAADESGRLADTARPALPYAESAAAQAQAQATAIFTRLDTILPMVSSSVADIVQIEQYVKLKAHASSYFKIATSKSNLGRAVPVAATAQVGAYVPDDAVVAVTGMAIVPDPGAGLVKEEPNAADASSNRKFSELIAAGPYAFATIFPSDRKTGIPAEARAASWSWSGSEIGSEIKWGLEELRGRLEAVGASFEDLVDYTLFLTDSGDLYEFDQALRAVVGDPAPTRTVVPSRGYALPRREGAFGHEQGAPRMEVQFRFRRPGGVEKRAIDGPDAGVGYQSAATKLGPLVWTSSLVADAAHLGGSVDGQIGSVLDKLATTLSNAGTDLSRSLRLRILLTERDDLSGVMAALRRAIPKDPPAVTVVIVPTALPVVAARVAVDAVASVAD